MSLHRCQSHSRSVSTHWTLKGYHHKQLIGKRNGTQLGSTRTGHSSCPRDVEGRCSSEVHRGILSLFERRIYPMVSENSEVTDADNWPIC